MNSRYPTLCSPIRLAGLTLKNRIFAAPTSLVVLGPNETYSKENLEYYKLKAIGGAALVTVGEGNIDPSTGRSHAMQADINAPGMISCFRDMADTIHSGGAAACIQLNHGGALCSPTFLGGKNAIGPSGYVDDWGDTVEELDEEMIWKLIGLYASGAKRAKDCGFDMVMIHAGHGWLIHQFISETTNHRTDQWGGSFENRMRFLLEVIRAVRAAVERDFPIEVRISATEYFPGGYGIETGVEIAKALDGKVDLIHVSAGTQNDPSGYSAVLTHPGCFQKDMANAWLAAEIKKHVKTPVLSIGAYNDPIAMEQALTDGIADCIGLGRALVADPFLPRKIMTGHEEQITPCIRCGECLSEMIEGGYIRCTVNPYIGRECDALHPLPVVCRKKVLIAGGGPAGMEAAIQAAKRGHTVTLCEKSSQLGAMEFADTTDDFKQPLRRYRDSQVKKVTELAIDLRLNTEVTPEYVREQSPDTLLIAVGAQPIIPPVPGVDLPHVHQGAKLHDSTELGRNVVIIGGSIVGCEIAISLARKGHFVTIVEMREGLAVDCGAMHRIALIHYIDEMKNISVHTETRCVAICCDAVACENKNGDNLMLPCDDVVLAAGMKSRTESVDALLDIVPETYVIGDARKAARIMQGTRDALDAVVSLGMM